ncbi:hypothetical protein Tco_0792652 [Tanacetum coccineum]
MENVGEINRDAFDARMLRFKGLGNGNADVSQPRRNHNKDVDTEADEDDRVTCVKSIDPSSVGGTSELLYPYSVASQNPLHTSFGESLSSTMDPSIKGFLNVEEVVWSSDMAGASSKTTNIFTELFPSLTEDTGNTLLSTQPKRVSAGRCTMIKQQVLGDRSDTHVDLFSSSLRVPSVPGTANIMWSDFPSEKCTEVMDTIWDMWDALLAENPNVTSDYSSYLGKFDPLESKVKGRTNIDDTIHVDESPIFQSVIVQDMPNSYAGATGGSKPIPRESRGRKKNGENSPMTIVKQTYSCGSGGGRGDDGSRIDDSFSGRKVELSSSSESSFSTPGGIKSSGLRKISISSDGDHFILTGLNLDVHCPVTGK